MSFSKYLLPVVAFLCISSALCAQGPKLGKIDFKPTGKEVAQNYFRDGLLYLHNFEYDDAIKQFQMAELLDPDFVMAYWGEAIAYNHTIWFWQNREKARGVMYKLGVSADQRVGLAKTELEKDFVRSLEILYDQKDDKHTRDKKYSDFMSGMHKKYPGYEEVGCFYALSLLGLCYNGPDFERWDKAANVLQPIIAKHPDHPGALNYLIFACDDPSRAYKAEKAAGHYAQIAASSEHALHAPSHTYTALGQWDKAVAANEAAWQMADELVQKKKLSLEDRDYHVLWWLVYGYLQQGKYARANELLADMNRDARYGKSARLRFFLAAIKGSYLVETRKWQSEAAGMQVPTEGLDLKIKALGFFLNGMASAAAGDMTKVDWFVQKIIDQISMEKNSTAQVAEFYSGGIKAVMKEGSAENDIRLATVMELELKAVKAMHENKHDDAFKLMDQATALEDKSILLNGPPIPAKPAHELYGELLLQANQPQKAEAQFDLALKKEPNRSLSLLGKYRAFKKSGDMKSAAQMKAILQKNWASADAQVKAGLNE